jgi:hypothetical protein
MEAMFQDLRGPNNPRNCDNANKKDEKKIHSGPASVDVGSSLVEPCLLTLGDDVRVTFYAGLACSSCDLHHIQSLGPLPVQSRISHERIHILAKMRISS